MTILEILDQCEQQIAQHPAESKCPAVISLFMHGNGRGERRKLMAAPGAPMGKIAAQYEDSDMVIFNAKDVAKFIKAAFGVTTANK